MLTALRTTLRQRRAYLRTKSELEHLPDAVARDLNIDPSNAAMMAARAVYG